VVQDRVQERIFAELIGWVLTAQSQCNWRQKLVKYTIIISVHK